MTARYLIALLDPRRLVTTWDGGWQLWLRWICITRTGGRTVVWLSVGGHKPLAHLPRWRRHLLHLPAVRVRLWRPLYVQVNSRRLVALWSYAVPESVLGEQD